MNGGLNFDVTDFYRSTQDRWLKRNRSDFRKRDDAANLKEFKAKIESSRSKHKFSVGSRISDGVVLFDEDDFWVVVEYKHGDASSAAYFIPLHAAIKFILLKLEGAA